MLSRNTGLAVWSDLVSINHLRLAFSRQLAHFRGREGRKAQKRTVPMVALKISLRPRYQE